MSATDTPSATSLAFNEPVFPPPNEEITHAGVHPHMTNSGTNILVNLPIKRHPWQTWDVPTKSRIAQNNTRHIQTEFRPSHRPIAPVPANDVAGPTRLGMTLAPGPPVGRNGDGGGEVLICTSIETTNGSKGRNIGLENETPVKDVTRITGLGKDKVSPSVRYHGNPPLQRLSKPRTILPSHSLHCHNGMTDHHSNIEQWNERPPLVASKAGVANGAKRKSLAMAEFRNTRPTKKTKSKSQPEITFSI
jgi:hypothetical protein